MISKFKKIFRYYKYVSKANFFISKKNFLIICLLTLLSLFSSFIIIYTSIPFLDFMLTKDPENHQKITKNLAYFLRNINLEPSFILFAGTFFFSVLFKSITDVVYSFYVTKCKYFYMQMECLTLNKKIFNMNQNFQIKYSTSRLLNLYTVEIERSSEVLSHLLLSMNFFLQLGIILVTTLYLNFELTILFFLILFVLISPIILINYYTIRLGITATNVTNNHYKALINNISYLKFITVHGILSIADKTFLKNFTPYKNNKLSLVIVGGVTSAFLQPMGILAVIISLYIHSGVNQNFTILGAIVWGFTRALGPINSLIAGLNVVSMEIPAFKNLYEIKNNIVDLEIVQGNKVIDNLDKITFKKISFKHKDKIIFNNLNFEVSRGEKIALLGDTGAGKSTLLDILTNVVKIDSGERLVNNVEYKDINFNEFRSKISYVSQSLPMLDATIREYFKFYKENIEDGEISTYLKFMNCDQFLKINADILDMYMGDKGMKLSGGQKQKIVLAAALSRKPEILILDESTNALDTNEEEKIMKKISGLNNNILIHVSHKLRNREIFDKIYNVENKTVNNQK